MNPGDVAVAARWSRYVQGLGVGGMLGCMLLGAVVSQAGAAVRASRGEITLPTYLWRAVRHPYFQGTDGRNIYPYPMLDFLSRDSTNRTYRTVVLENEYLRLTILPELGGRVHEVIDKTTGQPMFYVNHVIKPGLIGQCGAWISGGIEWNTGPQGHTVSCMQPVDVLVLPPEPDGSRSVAIGETERIYGTKWTVRVTLRPGRSFIEETIRIYNPTETIRPYYFWNCTAVPNTPGFRFIYPMTLGMDHSGETFFRWPVHEGKDLTRGTNYQDASSIFAYGCDQDFFGSYNDDLDRGVVSYANHHLLSGKKAWTWGHGGYGTMHQQDLTDDDGPYNEVQTGPLLTQGEVGRLDPCEAVEWTEWWYPIHGLGGFTYANRDVAVNVVVKDGLVRVRLLGTLALSTAVPTVKRADTGAALPIRPPGAYRTLSPVHPTLLEFDTEGYTGPWEVIVAASDQPPLAQFRYPPELPVREPPGKRTAPQSATELALAGWQHFLFGRWVEAETQFHKAIEKDAQCVEAQVGLAHLHLDRDPGRSAAAARAVLKIRPDHGPALYALGVAERRLGHETEALDAAWRATLDPATATAGRALVARILIGQGNHVSAIDALGGNGPWATDPRCLDLLAVAAFENRQADAATRAAGAALEIDPLDWLAVRVLEANEGVMPDDERGKHPEELVRLGCDEALVEALFDFCELRSRRLFEKLYGSLYWIANRSLSDPTLRNPFPTYLPALVLGSARLGPGSGAARGRPNPGEAFFPHQRELEPALRGVLERNPKDGLATLYLGHVLFHLGRHAEGRALWERAATLGAEPVIAYRALGMAAKTLDSDLKSAREWLGKASHADRADAIVARDLAHVLFALVDQAGSDVDKQALVTEARDRLQGAFEQGRGRSDFVGLLARAHNRLGDYAETARLLGQVRITVWEGAREAHDLFEEAHLALGRAHLEAGRAAEALREFDRALEYPANLATGRLENAREAHVQYWRGKALQALGRGPEAISAWRRAIDEPESDDAVKREARQKAREAIEAAEIKGR